MCLLNTNGMFKIVFKKKRKGQGEDGWQREVKKKNDRRRGK